MITGIMEGDAGRRGSAVRKDEHPADWLALAEGEC
jgi:hypothetical protein